jgi:hypothetical protein
LHLLEEEIQFLINKYRVSNDQVNYEEFCKNINQVFESDDFNQTQFEKKKQQMVYLTNARTKTCPPS